MLPPYSDRSYSMLAALPPAKAFHREAPSKPEGCSMNFILSSSRARLAAVLIAASSLAGIAPALAQVAPGGAPALSQSKPAPKPAAPAKPAAQAPAKPAEEASEGTMQAIVSGWQKLCGTDPEDNKEICQTIQTLSAETGQVIMAVNVFEKAGDKPADTKRMLRAILPLGLQLPPGVRLLIDNNPPVAGKFLLCFPNGCFADIDMTADLFAKLKKGTGLTVQAQNPQGRTVNYTMPLKDFAKINEGPAMDPKAVEEQQKKMQDELQKRADDMRKKLMEKQGAPAKQ